MNNIMNNTKIIYNIDMINGFVKEGILHDKLIMNAVPEQIKLLDKFKKENQPISFIRDSHKPNCTEFKNFPPHCIEGTTESELISELKPYEEYSVTYLKNSTSALFAPTLLDDLNKMNNLKEIVGVGCCTDICITNFLIPLKNYLNQIDKDIAVIAVRNAIETYDIKGIHDRDYYTKIAYELMIQAGIIVVDDIKELEKFEKQLVLKGRKYENI